MKVEKKEKKKYTIIILNIKRPENVNTMGTERRPTKIHALFSSEDTYNQ